MRTKILLLFLLGWVGMAFGQNQSLKDAQLDRLSKNVISDSTQQTANQKLISEIKKIISEENSDTTEIGFFHIRNYAIIFKNRFPIDQINDFSIIREDIDNQIKNKSLYTKVTVTAGKDLVSIGEKRINGKKTNDTIVFARKGDEFKLDIGYIDSVAVAINEGVIEHLRVFTKGGNTFSNTDSPIPLITIEKRFNDKLYNPRDNSFIFLKDAIYFEANRRFNYFPEDDELKVKNTFNSDGTITLGSKKLIANNSLNSLVNLQVYSDLLAVFGNEANGLMQFEANSKFYLHRGTYRNKYVFMPFDAIEPFFHFSRIDSKFDTIAISSAQEVNRLEIFRRYTYAVGVDANIMRADFRPNNSFEIKLGYFYSSSNLNIGDNKTSIALHNPYAELVLKSRKLNNFSLDLRARFMFQKMNPNAYIDNDEWNQLVSFRAGICYFPNKNKADKIFLRFINYLNLSNRKEDFSLLQLGFSKAISF
ncbi:hypothetical protein DRF62_17005 [Chryseobacterium piscium]|uniref:Uncharacterized protein n=1 Tax=Chryseobacterium piscium TaxID=333702 RepID=A0A3D9BDD5_9FLAO|nr:hypothetical protein [Chryseobacterium piscium]REC51605.1 hypothetical protein DRF62_17005 [Chryseobacterium piscium]